MSTIERIDVTPFSVPYVRPLRMKVGDLLAADHVLVSVRTSDGVVGYAEAPARPMFYGETQASICAAVTRLIGPQLVGTPTLAASTVAGVLRSVRFNHTARAAVEMAAADARAKELGITGAELLGGTDAPVLAAHMIGAETPDDAVADIEDAVETWGARAFKVKVGYGPAKDRAMLEAVRATVGADPLIYLDANRAYQVSESRRILGPLCDELDIAWIEEPFFERANLRNGSPAERGPGVPRMLDESTISAADLLDKLATESFELLSIKVARTGFTDSRTMAEVARLASVGVLMGSQGDAAIGTFSGLAFASTEAAIRQRPAELSYFTRLKDDVVATLPTLTDGYVRRADTTPGFGIEIDHDKLSHYSAKGV